MSVTLNAIRKERASAEGEVEAEATPARASKDVSSTGQSEEETNGEDSKE